MNITHISVGKCNRDRFLSKFFDFLLSSLFHQSSTHSYSIH
jgi:hypothetical protein